MRKIFFVCLFSVLLTSLFAQSGESTYDYLLLPTSVRTAALGGTNVSLIETDVSLIHSNPAFLGQEMDMNLGVSYLSYVGDVAVGSVTFGKAVGERSAWGIGVNYTNYGNMLETTEDCQILGDLNASDICGSVFFSRDLTDKIRGGVAVKVMYSNYHHNTSVGLAADLGISYYDVDSEFSFGLVGKNLGRQVSSYEDNLYALPWDIQLGISKKLSHAPIRISVTANYLKQWEFDSLEEEDSFFKTLGKHIILGVDLTPNDNFWIGIGYNIKRGIDLGLDEGNKFGGFSAGAGLKVKAFSFGCSLGQYHPSATSFMFSVSTSFVEMKL